MDHLPAGFAETLGRVVEPGQDAAVAAVITGLFAVETKGRVLEEASP